MENYEIGIQSFIRDPFQSYIRGCRPSYLDCVSCCANDLWRAMTAPLRIWFEFHDVMDMTVSEFLAMALAAIASPLIPFLFPIFIWYGGYNLKKRLAQNHARRMQTLAAYGIKGRGR